MPEARKGDRVKDLFSSVPERHAIKSLKASQLQDTMDTNSLEIKQGKRTFANMAFCDESMELPQGYQVSDKDILCGRGTNHHSQTI